MKTRIHRGDLLDAFSAHNDIGRLFDSTGYTGEDCISAVLATKPVDELGLPNSVWLRVDHLDAEKRSFWGTVSELNRDPKLRGRKFSAAWDDIPDERGFYPTTLIII